MKELFNLSIPNPCNEKWENFRRTSKGGFCSSCSKVVIDFTSMTDSEIKAYFKKPNDSTCGRFRSSQLKTYSEAPKNSRFRFLPLHVLGLSLLISNIKAQTIPAHSSPQEVVQKDIWCSPSEVPDSARARTIQGVVKSAEDSTPLPGVNVFLKGTTTGTVTDADGKFSLTITLTKPSDVLVFSFIGLETMQVIVGDRSELNVEMKNDIVQLGGAAVVAGGIRVHRFSPRSLWWKFKNLFRDK
jgi:hypothetical protein